MNVATNIVVSALAWLVVVSAVIVAWARFLRVHPSTSLRRRLVVGIAFAVLSAVLGVYLTFAPAFESVVVRAGSGTALGLLALMFCSLSLTTSLLAVLTDVYGRRKVADD